MKSTKLDMNCFGLKFSMSHDLKWCHQTISVEKENLLLFYGFQVYSKKVFYTSREWWGIELRLTLVNFNAIKLIKSVAVKQASKGRKQ